MKRFIDKIQKTETCWLWTAGKFPSGYGKFKNDRKDYRAHRFAYELWIGPIPEEKIVCHSCDNPGCVNPAHLWLGTHQDNVDDKVRKGRQARGDKCGSRLYPERRPRGDRNGSRLHPERMPKGERHGRAKLTDNLVREIRKLYATGEYTQIMLGKQFGVSNSSISYMLSGKTWSHVNEAI